jgi:predicted CoA-substrate-specific enzyme activase
MDPAPALYCGVDVGASATKLVLIDEKRDVQAQVVRLSGVDYSSTARTCLSDGLEQIGAAEATVARTVSTGYGRHNVEFRDASLTEIHCHGVGCFHHFPRAMTIIDIGGQDNKVIRLEASGQRVDFKMNRKCAAGTGAFLEEMALRLGIGPSEMNGLAEGSEEAVRLNSFCTVFAKTEILAHLRRGVDVSSLVRGAFLSVINRVTEMDLLQGDVVISGGVVAYNPVIAEILAEQLGKPVLVPPDPQFAGALGAALTALKQASAGSA